MKRRGFLARALGISAASVIAGKAIAQAQERYAQKADLDVYTIHTKRPDRADGFDQWPKPREKDYIWTPISIEEVSPSTYILKLNKTFYPVVGMLVIDSGYRFKKSTILYTTCVVTRSDEPFTYVTVMHTENRRQRRPPRGPLVAYPNTMQEA